MGTLNKVDNPKGYECKKFGNLITICGDITTEGGILLSLPESIRPPRTKLSAGCMMISTGTSCFIRIYDTGNVSVYTYTGAPASGRIIFDITYTLD